MAIRQPLPRAPIPDDDDWSMYDGVEMTDEEFLALDDRYETDLELIDGVAREKGVVNRNHRSITWRLAAAFWDYAQGHGGEAGPEGRVRLRNGRFVKPDMAYWLPGIPSGNDSLPTVATEVRSPGQTIASQRRKCRTYREAGVPIAWFIDPLRRVVEVFEGDLDAEPLPPEGVLRSDLLPGFELPVADLWTLLD
jgi:Uma2 family endonuclease